MTIRTDISEWTITDSKRQINFPLGARRVHRVDVVDDTEAPQSMAGWDLAYVWRNQAGTLVFAKTTAVDDGLTVGDGAGTNDRATATISRDDTVDLSPGRYSWALWRTDSDNDDVLAEGTLVLSAPAAQPPEAV